MNITTSKQFPELLQSTTTEQDFSPSKDESCFCNSGKTFGECCGSTSHDRKPPFGVFVFENYLDRSIVDNLVEFANQRRGERLMVIDQKASTADNIVKVEDERRVAERVDLGERRTQLNDIVKNIYITLARDCYGQQLAWYEHPELMRYYQGGLYVRHADSHNPNPQTNSWTKVIDRDLSLLIYLNDSYQGGGLTFTKFNYHIQPKAGMVVIFPSDFRYVHSAETVIQGVRYAVVSWAAVTGMSRISSRPPESAINLQPDSEINSPV